MELEQFGYIATNQDTKQKAMRVIIAGTGVIKILLQEEIFLKIEIGAWGCHTTIIACMMVSGCREPMGLSAIREMIRADPPAHELV